MTVTPIQNLISTVVAQGVSLQPSTSVTSGGDVNVSPTNATVPPSNVSDPALVQNVSGQLVEASGLYNATIALAGLNTQITSAQSGTQQITALLQKLWDLAQQIANGGDGASLDSLESQFQSLFSQINQIVTSTSFGSGSLLDGSFSLDNTALGSPQDSTAQPVVPNLSIQGLFGNSPPDISTPANAAAALGTIADAQGIANGANDNLDNLASQVNFALASVQTAQSNSQAATSTLNTSELGSLDGFIQTLLGKPQASASTQGTKLSSSLLGLISND